MFFLFLFNIFHALFSILFFLWFGVHIFKAPLSDSHVQSRLRITALIHM